MLAGVGVGAFAGIEYASDCMVHVDRTFEPRREACAVYDELFAIYQSLYPGLRDTFQRLGEVPSGG